MKTDNNQNTDAMNTIIAEQTKVESAIKKDGHFYAKYSGHNYAFEQMGHVYPYEYCIETQPLHPTADGSKSCPMFGHDCPGGAWQAFFCRLGEGRPRRHEYTPISGQ